MTTRHSTREGELDKRARDQLRDEGATLLLRQYDEKSEPSARLKTIDQLLSSSSALPESDHARSPPEAAQ